MAEYQGGFKAYADDHPEVGVALEDERYIGEDWSYQPTSRGKLEYYKPSNTVAFYPKGQS